jgi:DNA polymerase III sliding clamp (beta) subunit (PCNA family)
MLDALKFVKGAVSKKDYQPALAHFRIKEGRVTGYNGTIALSSPIDLDIDACPRAIPFVKAIERCTSGTVAIHITPGGKLSVRSGKFRANVDCTDENEILDGIVPEGNEVSISGQVVPALRVLEPFIATDASRPWAMGVLLRNYSAYATNNIIIAEYWIGANMPEVNLPVAAIDELIRIGEEPIRVLMSDRSMTFFFTGDRWMRTQVLGVDWPDVEPILSLEADLSPVPAGIFEALETLKPFVEEEGRVYFRGTEITTSPHDGVGASIELDGLPTRGAFNYKYLMALEGRVDEIDFSKAPPVPCPFRGENMRGVILGMVDA